MVKSRVLLGMAIPPLIGIRNPYNGYINPTIGLMTIPYYILDPDTFEGNRFFRKLTTFFKRKSSEPSLHVFWFQPLVFMTLTVSCFEIGLHSTNHVTIVELTY